MLQSDYMIYIALLALFNSLGSIFQVPILFVKFFMESSLYDVIWID